jgi:hypothetical protein
MEGRSPRQILSAGEAGGFHASRRRRRSLAEKTGQGLPDPGEPNPAPTHAPRHASGVTAGMKLPVSARTQSNPFHKFSHSDARAKRTGRNLLLLESTTDSKRLHGRATLQRRVKTQRSATGVSAPAAKRRKNAAHGASRGKTDDKESAPEGRKNQTKVANYAPAQSALELRRDSL